MKWLLRQDLCRNIMSLKFLFAVIGVTLVMLLSNVEDLLVCIREDAGSVLYMFEMVTNGGWFFLLIFLLAALVSSVGYCDDYSNGFLFFLIVRSDIKRYGKSKALSCFISAFLSVAAGILLSLFVLSLLLPLCNGDKEITDVTMLPYRKILQEGNYILYFGVKTCLIAGGASLWCMAGLLASAYKPEPIYAVTAPLILNYVGGRFALLAPDFLNPDYVMIGFPLFRAGVSWQLTFLYSCFYIMAANMLLYIFFYRKVKQYVRGEVV